MPEHNRRNFAARSPYMKKGGSHTTAPSAQRAQHRVRSADAMSDYYDYLKDSGDETLINVKGVKEESGGSSFGFLRNALLLAWS